MLGETLVFIKTIGSKYETILKGLTLFFFKILFTLSKPRQGFKFFLKKIHLGLKASVLRHVILVGFQSQFSHTNYYKFYYLKN
jgi:hypothetical protein